MVLSFKIVLATTFLIGVCFLPFFAVAQTTHVVGGNMGWVIPSGDAGAYTTWAASRSFVVGDKLVFNYASGQHDVAHSSKSAYDACNAALPIISTTMAAPATITLTTAGENYFFCTIGRHCASGQKLAINVSAAVSSPSPSPALAPTPAPARSRKVGAPVPSAESPSPVTAQAPGPSTSTGAAPKTYTVGDNMGWTVPSGGEAAYTTWASDKNFAVGDTLVFPFTTGRHDVAEVSKTAYGSCTSSNSISQQTTGPARITLTSSGEHFYICTFGSHCSLGQKLAINVTGANSPAPTSGAIPPSTPNLSSPSPVGSTPNDNPGNYASSTSVSGLYAVALSIFIAYMLH